MFRFCLQLLSETFLILRIIQREIINVHTSYCKVPVTPVLVYSTWIILTDIETYWGIKLHENPSSGNLVVPCGWTDRLSEADIVTFHIFANAPTKASGSACTSTVMVYPDPMSLTPSTSSAPQLHKTQTWTLMTLTQQMKALSKWNTY